MTARAQTLILGGGLAGAVAALALARRGDAVSVAAGPPGASAQWSGALDVFGPCLRDPDSGDLITDPHARLQNLLLRRPHHPYRVAGLTSASALSGALADACGLLNAGSHGPDLLNPTARGWCMTPLGAPRWCDGASVTVGVWSPTDPAPVIGVVDFLNFAGFDAPQAAATLRDAGIDATAYAVAAPWLPATPPLTDDPIIAARRLDASPDLDWEPVAAALRAASSARPPTLWLLPPILGADLTAARAHLQRLTAALGALAAEASAQHASLHGWRLHRALQAKLSTTPNIQTLPPQRVVSLRLTPSGVEVAFSDGATTIAERVILATGRWASSGLPRRGPWREPLTGAPLWLDAAPMTDTPPNPPRLLAPDFSADHPLLRVGVAVNPSGLILDAHGDPLSPRLYAIGSALHGTSAPTDACAAGVALCAVTVAR
jgi:glycerol-3-phosphate dehydrogenase subunit B